MKRRAFLKASVVTVATATIALKSENASAGLLATRKGFPVWQVFTNDTSAQFKVMASSSFSVNYRALDSKGVEYPVELLSRTPNPYDAAQNFDHLIVNGIKVGVTYTLEVRDSTSKLVIDSREFAALETGSKNLSFALLSCMQDSFPQSGMWQSVSEARPDLMFFIGDTCYANWSSDDTPAGHWKRNIETFTKLDVYYWKRLIPILATWDDHDYGKGDGDRFNNPIKEESLFAFKTFFGSADRPGYKNGPGVSSMLNVRGHRFCLMDDRYFRDPAGTPEGLQWGLEQERWLLDEVRSSQDPVWLFNGSQFFGGYRGKESLEHQHPFQLKRVLEELSRVQAPVMFGSGDVHFSELMKLEPALLGYETIEVTSSAMHSTTFPGNQNRGPSNPRRFAKATWHNNYVLIQSDASEPRTAQIRTRSIGKTLKKVYFDQTFTIKR
ncbi:MAG: hypothetical protein V4692_01520 [Bdellovibrionota bacterium]